MTHNSQARHTRFRAFKPQYCTAIFPLKIVREFKDGCGAKASVAGSNPELKNESGQKIFEAKDS